MPSPRRLVPAVVLAAAVGAACGRVVAPPPPSSQPVLVEQRIVPGVPVAVAARAARVFRDAGFITRRFGSDSTWAYRSDGPSAARLRYSRPADDSTRVQVELWLTCVAADRRCGRAELATLVRRLNEVEGEEQ